MEGMDLTETATLHASEIFLSIAALGPADGRQQVALCKAFNTSLDAHIDQHSASAISSATPSKPADHLSTNLIHALNALIVVIMSSEVVHDEYVNVFKNICTCLHINHYPHHDAEDDECNRIVEYLLESIHSTEYASLAVLNVKRVEYMCECIDSVLRTLYIEESRVFSSLTSYRIISCLDGLFVHLKQLKVLSKDFKSVCSQLRRTVISLCKSILLACPAVAVTHSSAVWALCTVTLATPKLFAVLYAALHNSPLRDEFRARIVQHLVAALDQLGKYSCASAVDIVLSIHELHVSSDSSLPQFDVFASCGQIEPELFFNSVINAYLVVPRVSKAEADAYAELRHAWLDCLCAIHSAVAVTIQSNSCPSSFASTVNNRIMELAIIDYFALSRFFSRQSSDLGEELEAQVVLVTQTYLCRLSAEQAASLLVTCTAGIVSMLDSLSDLETAPSQSHDRLLLLLFLTVNANATRNVVFDDEKCQLHADADLAASLLRISERLSVDTSALRREAKALTEQAECLHGRSNRDSIAVGTIER